MTSFNRRMPAGIPGDVNRAQASTIESLLITQSPTTGFPAAYGVPLVIDVSTAKARVVAAGDKNVYGFFVRPFPFQGNGTDGLGTSTPPAAPYTSGLGDVLKRGYISVLLNGAAAVKRGFPVFVRVTNAAGGKPIGGVEGAADFVSAPNGAGGAGANTGNGTNTAISAGPRLQPGDYLIKFTGALAYDVIDPNGFKLASVTALGAYTSAEINFTVTAGGTAFVAGDGFKITSNHMSLGERSYFMGPADATANVEIAFNI